MEFYHAELPGPDIRLTLLSHVAHVNIHPWLALLLAWKV
jgi:hypothetical protein